MARVLKHFQRLKNGCLDALASRFTRWTKPLGTFLPLATVADLGRRKSELIAENALLRHWTRTKRAKQVLEAIHSA
jgi:hypothetical protein